MNPSESTIGDFSKTGGGGRHKRLETLGAREPLLRGEVLLPSGGLSKLSLLSEDCGAVSCSIPVAV